MDRNEMTTTRAAELTGYSHTHLKRLARSGQVQARKVGPRRWLFDVEGVLSHKARSASLGARRYLGIKERTDDHSHS